MRDLCLKGQNEESDGMGEVGRGTSWLETLSIESYMWGAESLGKELLG